MKKITEMTKLEKAGAEIVLARQHLAHAQESARAAALALDKARQNSNDAQQKLAEAKLARDELLPKVHKFRLGEHRPTVLCVVKQTAKTITARYPGGQTEYVYRLNKDGVWRETGGYSTLRMIEDEK